MLRLYEDAVAVSVGNVVLEGYRDVAACLASSGLNAALDKAVRRIGGVARWYFNYYEPGAFVGQAPNLGSYAYRHEDGIDGVVDLYLTRFFLSDPVIQFMAAARTAPRGIAVSINPSDIPDPLYRTRYMEERGIVQRLSLIHQSGSRSMIMNLSRTTIDGELDRRTIEQFGAFSMLLFPLLARHEQLTSLPAEMRTIGIHDIEVMVRRRYPELTERESQVCARTVVGRSTKGIARELGIGAESVATYRKRAYHRTGVTCIEQLSRSIMN